MSLAQNPVAKACPAAISYCPDLRTGNSARSDEKLLAANETLAPSQGCVELPPCRCYNHPILKPIQKLP